MLKKVGRVLISGPVILLILNVFSSGLNYLYQIVASRVLGVESFGVLNALFSFITIVGVPGGTITMMLAKTIAYYQGNKKPENSKGYIRVMTKNVYVLSFAVLGVLVILYPIIGNFLHVPTLAQMIIVALVCAVSYFQPFYSGCMSGLQSFVLLGLYSVLIPFFKLLGLAVAERTSLEMRISVCLMSMVIGSLMALVVGRLYVSRKFDGVEDKTVKLSDYKEWLYSFVVSFGMVFYFNADILAVRNHGNDEVTGLYSAASLFGRIMYYLATTAGTVIIPKVAATTRKKSLHILHVTLLLLVGIQFGGTAVVILIGKQALTLVYGIEYIGAVHYLPYVGLIALSMALISVISSYSIGVGNNKAVVGMMVILAMVVLAIIMIPVSPERKLLALGVAGLITSCVNLGVIEKNNKQELENV